MSNALRLVLGTDAHCTDGRCGALRRVVLDPVRRTVTHVVVEGHFSGDGRLVPVDLIQSTEDDLRLRCSHETLDQLEPAEHLWAGPGQDGVDGEGLLSPPYYGGVDSGAVSVLGDFGGNLDQPILEDTVPTGDVEVSRYDDVRATDGHVGVLAGVLAQPEDFRVTHVLAREGHLWHRRIVAIPWDRVAKVDFGVTLTMSRSEVEQLPVLDAPSPGTPAPRRPPGSDDRERSS